MSGTLLWNKKNTRISGWGQIYLSYHNIVFYIVMSGLIQTPSTNLFKMGTFRLLFQAMYILIDYILSQLIWFLLKNLCATNSHQNLDFLNTFCVGVKKNLCIFFNNELMFFKFAWLECWWIYSRVHHIFEIEILNWLVVRQNGEITY